MLIGRILGVFTSSEPGVPKYTRPRVVVGDHGLVGDYHNNPLRKDFGNPGQTKPNVDRHITIVGWEAVANVNRELGLSLGPGDLGENILTAGLGDLSTVQPGQTIHIGDSIRLEVVKHNTPCEIVAGYHPDFNKTIYSRERPRRGLLCKIVHGHGHTIVAGETITIP